ncbi:MAG: hypothetical protein LIO65_07005, partial [Odoribacter sp.]|nr:hypothetical protein [Odoribacter sp.]
EWFVPVYGGSETFSELNAIRLYTSDSAKLDDEATLFMGVSLVEMLHRDKLGDFILALGGNIDSIPYNNAQLLELQQKSTKKEEALRTAIDSEKDTIKEYQRIKKLCLDTPESATRTTALKLLEKLIADEKKHTEIFENALSSSSKPKDKNSV